MSDREVANDAKEFGTENRPVMLNDRIEAEYEGERITIWNHLTITQRHYVTVRQTETRHEVSVGDAPGNEPPDYITPQMDDDLQALDVYPDVVPVVVDPTSEEVDVL
jgi:hypothetical protein